ncbi:MAG: anti sigma-factor antagonist [Syntrophus sp. SKADARSKE-3]|nr:anti sigma-factor antagonist [Syntrophus sp. SKADARSKE-3]
MDLQKMDIGDVRVFIFEGRLDVSRCAEVELELYDAIDGGIVKLILDLAKIECLSSSGLRIFIAALRRLKELSGRLAICNISPHVFKVFKAVDLDRVFEIYNTTDQAIARLQSPA